MIKVKIYQAILSAPALLKFIESALLGQMLQVGKGNHSFPFQEPFNKVNLAEICIPIKHSYHIKHEYVNSLQRVTMKSGTWIQVT